MKVGRKTQPYIRKKKKEMLGHLLLFVAIIVRDYFF